MLLLFQEKKEVKSEEEMTSDFFHNIMNNDYINNYKLKQMTFSVKQSATRRM